MGVTTKKVFYCDSCAKDQDEVLVLIALPKGYICEECVGLCAEIVDMHRKAKEDKK